MRFFNHESPWIYLSKSHPRWNITLNDCRHSAKVHYSLQSLQSIIVISGKFLSSGEFSEELHIPMTEQTNECLTSSLVSIGNKCVCKAGARGSQKKEVNYLAEQHKKLPSDSAMLGSPKLMFPAHHSTGVARYTKRSAPHMLKDTHFTERPLARALVGVLYAVIFSAVSLASVCALQWGVDIDHSFQEFFKPNYIFPILLGRNSVLSLNLVLIACFYFALIAITNRFWVATPIITAFFIAVATAERLKVTVRSEPIMPSDVKMAGSNASGLMEFVPTGSSTTIVHAILLILGVIALSVGFRFFMGKGRLFRSSITWRMIVARVGAAVISLGFFVCFAAAMSNIASWAARLSQACGDSPALFDTLTDAKTNGTLLSFMRYVNPKIMDKPANYSKSTMTALAKKYQNTADTINQTRTENLTDSSVILILSESYSDPTRVPGLSWNADPMPFIRNLKNTTTSGLMLSSGYGGGTANLEFQALTGLSMANFGPSLTSPYQQLVPGMKWTPSFNQAWNEYANSSKAVHPLGASMYMRQTNYEKFGFSSFATLSGPQYVKYTDRIGNSPYVSDEAAYKDALAALSTKSDTSQFIQLVTIQNHMNYDSWYGTDFKATSTTETPISSDEQLQVDTYAQGVNYTDQATSELLNKINALDKPVTIIFYGDHLPGIYQNASKNPKNNIALHETDYFIWSNNASASHTTKLNATDSAYSSPNYFMSQAAEHTNSRVSPYLAFLTQMHKQVPAMEPPVSSSTDWAESAAGTSLYLDANGNQIDTSKLSADQKSMLADYKLIQYDITVGKNFLKDTTFMDLPEVAKTQE
jgi:phosphoglycerol transferase MdoB-like AlkP superfamily enzyme